MKIAVIGTGYVGLVTAAVFSKLGHEVWALDIDKEKIENLKRQKIPFFEPGLEVLVLEGIKNYRLKFTADYQEAISRSQLIFICVGTPPKENGDYDLSFVFSAAKSLAPFLKKEAVVVIKSTVPPGTCNQVKKIIEKINPVKFMLASCPEFLREGSAVADSFYPSRIIIGTDSEKAKKLLLQVHKDIKAPRVLCDLNSAQLIKYAANAFLAAKISFINAIAILCDKIGADILKVEEGLGLDPRIGKSFLKAGLGYGGSCFPKDIQALIAFAKRQNYNFDFLKEVDLINKKQTDYLIEKLARIFNQKLNGKIVTILGLSFKPQTDDLRESRAILLIQKLVEKGVKVKTHDPVALKLAKQTLTKIIKTFKKEFPVYYFEDIYEALKDSEALILATEWPVYQRLDFKKIKQLMKRPIIIDGRNFLKKEKLKKLGFYYEGIGTY